MREKFDVFFLHIRRNIGRNKGRTVAVILVIGVTIGMFFLPGGIIYATTLGNSAITIGNGYFSVSGQFIGNNTYTESEIKTAFVVDNINSGNLTLATRNAGTSLGNLNVGIYTLSNGASAHIVSVNQTDLVIELDSGLHLVLGTSNTNALVTAFSANAIPVAGS